MCWSLGNESGTGANLAACARWFHERAGGRAVVHYEGDHALWCTLPDGRRALSYGGDFGEEVHDGNFVCDGLVDVLSRPYAGTWAWVAAMAPDALALAHALENTGSGRDDARLHLLR